MFSALWIEMVIAGYVYLVALIFLLLGIAGIGDLSLGTEVRDLLPYLAVGSVPVAYLLGVLVHRLIQMMPKRVWQYLARLFRLKNPGKTKKKQFYRAKILVWQKGSTRLHRELDFQFALDALFRSLVVGVPFLVACLSYWMVRVARTEMLVETIVLGVLLTVGFFFAYRKQRLHLHRIERLAAKTIEGE